MRPSSFDLFSSASRLLCAGALLWAMPVTANAQFAHFARDAALTPQDLHLASEAARSLYTKAGVTSGETAAWRNPKSEANGIVEVLEVEADGPCVVFRHIANTTKKSGLHYYIRRCRDANGQWLLAAN